MWRRLRDEEGWPIISSWIDSPVPTDGLPDLSFFADLWARFQQEIQACSGLLLYAQSKDFPIKGALVECGMALGLGKPVAMVLPGVTDTRALGTWLHHPNVRRFEQLDEAKMWLMSDECQPMETRTTSYPGAKP